MLFSKNTFTRRLQALLLNLFVLSLMIILHSIALSGGLYWIYWWFDVLTHSLGGFSAGLFFSTIYSGRFVWFFMFPILGIFIIWEFFEFFIGKVNILSYEQYIFDTIIDISIASLLACVAIYMISSSVEK